MAKRVIVDNGEITEPVEGWIAVSPETLQEYAQSDLQLMVRVVGKFSYMNASSIGFGAPVAYGYGISGCNMERIINHTIHQQSVILESANAEGMEEGMLQIPFSFILPQELPPSCSLLSTAAFTQNFGVQYFVEAMLHSANASQVVSTAIQQPNTCALKFLKTHLFVENRDVSPVVIGQKATGNPVSVKATLLKGIVEVGQPLQIQLDIDNSSAKEIKCIQAHLKQTVVINMGSANSVFGGKSGQTTTSMINSKEFFETIPGNSRVTKNLVILPEIEASNGATNIAFTRLNPHDTPQLCASYKPVPGTFPAITISYYLNMKLKVAGGSDLKVKIPVEISGVMPQVEEVPAGSYTLISDEEKEEWFGQLVEMGFPLEHVRLGLESVKYGTIVDVIDWIGRNATRMAMAAESLRNNYIFKNNAHIREDANQSRPGSLVVVVDNHADFI